MDKGESAYGKKLRTIKTFAMQFSLNLYMVDRDVGLKRLGEFSSFWLVSLGGYPARGNLF